MNVNSTSSSTSTSTTSGYYNRLTGLASGLDTDAMVKSMMQAQQTKIDKADQQKQLLQFQQDAYRDIIKDLRDFYSKYTDVTKADTSLLLSKNYQSSTFTTADTSGAVTAEGLAGAQIGTYKVKVNSLATKANLTLDNLSGLKGTNVSLKINNTDINVDLTSVNDDDAAMSAINNAISNAGVAAKMVKSDLTGKYILQTTQTGSSQSIVYSGTTYTGTDADVNITDSFGNTVNNKTYSSNSFVVDNVKFTISDTTSSEVTFTGKTDVSALKKRIVDFVSDYNKLIDKITTKLQEKKNSNYKPLTDAQKESMTEEQITQWETKAKEGILRNDSYISSIVSQLRSSINTAVSGTTIKYTDLGIDFSNDYTKSGQLTIDETKLQTALENNPDQVLKLFTNSSSSTDSDTKYKENGIMQRFKNILYDNTYSSTSLLLKKVGYEGSTTFYSNTLKTSIDDQAKLITELKTQYQDQQTRLYKKFSTLETIMSNYNAQSTYLSSMFS